MLKNPLAVLLCAAAILWMCGDSMAESYRLYRYTDAKGKRVFVNSLEDVPAEFRPSASALVVIKNPPAEEQAAEPSAQAANGAAVKVLSLSLAATQDGKCGFKGEVKNEMKAKAEGVRLHIDIKLKEQAKSFEVLVGAGGALNPSETAPVEYVADAPAAELTGYSYNVSWQTSRVEAAPAKPAQKPQAEVSAPAGGSPAPAPEPVRRYRTRNHPPLQAAPSK